jgi:sulfur relay (sulfurtransferase) DsrF/TusC family protein
MRTLLFLEDQIPHNSKADEQALDDALSCTFPASDPVAITFHFPFTPVSTPTEISQR